MKSLKYIKRTWPLFFFATFFSCGDECGSPPPVPVISYDDPVYEGDYLVMTARGGTDHIYTWSGPNNFSAEGRIQEFENVQVFHSGDYVVTVQEDGCSGITNTNKLTVLPQPIPCTPLENALQFEDAQIIMQDASPICKVDEKTDQYTLTAVATTGEFYLTFPTSSPPAYDRFYKVVQPDLSLAENEVHIRTLTGTEPFKNYNVTSGRLYARLTAFGFDIYFCDLQFQSQDEILIGSGNFRCSN